MRRFRPIAGRAKDCESTEDIPRHDGLPYRLRNLAGVVADVGTGVARFTAGDRVQLYHHVPCRACVTCDAKDYAQCPGYKRTGVTAGWTKVWCGRARPPSRGSP